MVSRRRRMRAPVVKRVAAAAATFLEDPDFATARTEGLSPRNLLVPTAICTPLAVVWAIPRGSLRDPLRFVADPRKVLRDLSGLWALLAALCTFHPPFCRARALVGCSPYGTLVLSAVCAPVRKGSMVRALCSTSRLSSAGLSGRAPSLSSLRTSSSPTRFHVAPTRKEFHHASVP